MSVSLVVRLTVAVRRPLVLTGGPLRTRVDLRARAMAMAHPV
jgi:hypothetical protein